MDIDVSLGITLSAAAKRLGIPYADMRAAARFHLTPFSKVEGQAWTANITELDAWAASADGQRIIAAAKDARRRS